MSEVYEHRDHFTRPKTAKDVPHARVTVQNDGDMPKAVYHVRRHDFVPIEPGQIECIVVYLAEARTMQVSALMTRLTVLKVEKLDDHLYADALSAPDYRPKGVLERKHGAISVGELRRMVGGKRKKNAG